MIEISFWLLLGFCPIYSIVVLRKIREEFSKNVFYNQSIDATGVLED
jgi:hypothetical protein